MSSPKPVPKQKVVVLQLMEFFQTEQLSETSKNGIAIPRLFLFHKCPRKECSVKVIKFLDKTGYNNPFTHLRTCYGKGKSLAEQESHILGLYGRHLKEKKPWVVQFVSIFSLDSEIMTKQSMHTSDLL